MLDSALSVERCGQPAGLARPTPTRPPSGTQQIEAPRGRYHTMEKSDQLDKFVCPFGGQEITLSQVEYDSGGIPLLRLRIREKHRFTIFEVDPATAQRWGQALIDWAAAQRGEKP